MKTGKLESGCSFNEVSYVVVWAYSNNNKLQAGCKTLCNEYESAIV